MEFGIWNWEFGIWEFGILELETWHLEFGFWNLEFGILIFGIRNLEFGNLELGIWNLEFGIWNLEREPARSQLEACKKPARREPNFFFGGAR